MRLGNVLSLLIIHVLNGSLDQPTWCFTGNCDSSLGIISLLRYVWEIELYAIGGHIPDSAEQSMDQSREVSEITTNTGGDENNVISDNSDIDEEEQQLGELPSFPKILTNLNDQGTLQNANIANVELVSPGQYRIDSPKRSNDLNLISTSQCCIDSPKHTNTCILSESKSLDQSRCCCVSLINPIKQYCVFE